METPSQDHSTSNPWLDQISTRWPVLNDPVQFLMRYGPAIKRYLTALTRDADDADEILQQFLLRGLQRGFVRTATLRGRFRDYLKAAVRNAALTHFRRKHLVPSDDFTLGQLAAPADGPPAADQQWLAEWRQCVLGRAWQALESHQRRSPGNLCHTVLRISVEHAEEDSRALAARVSTLVGRPLKPEAFRKQVSRARRIFAELLVNEVEQTLEDPRPEQVEEELIDIGLMEYVRDFLPPDWRTRGKLIDEE